ncbi:MAG: hypothetical protein WD031_04125, partial [Gemmatimonadota bacterium]
QLIVEKKRELAREIGQEIVAEVRGGKPLEEAAQERGLSLESTGPLTRTGFNPTLGQANAATGAAFGVPIGELSDAVSTQTGLFIIRPTSRIEADREEFEAQREQIRQAATFQLQQEAVNRWLEDLRREADILDRRRDVLVAS